MSSGFGSHSRWPTSKAPTTSSSRSSRPARERVVYVSNGRAYLVSMIDFDKQSVFKLSACNPDDVRSDLAPVLVGGEEIVDAFKGSRDFVAFTNKRVIAVNVQGMTGKKRDFSSLPYAKVQAFSVETAERFDVDAELDLWFSGLGKVRFEFKGSSDIRQIGQMITQFVL